MTASDPGSLLCSLAVDRWNGSGGTEERWSGRADERTSGRADERTSSRANERPRDERLRMSDEGGTSKAHRIGPVCLDVSTIVTGLSLAGFPFHRSTVPPATA